MAFVLRCTFLLQFVSLYLPCGFKADWGVVGCNFCCNLFLLACLVGLHQDAVVGCKYLSQFLLASLMGLIQFGCCVFQFFSQFVSPRLTCGLEPIGPL